MERDLSVIRKKRALRDGVKLPLPASSPMEVPGESANLGQETEAIQMVADGDLPMLDADVMTSQLQGLTDTNQSLDPTQVLGDDTMMEAKPLSHDNTQSASLSLELPEQPSTEQKDTANPAEGEDQNTGAKVDEIMATANEPGQQGETSGADFDFESMFNDTDFTAADGAMNFDIDLSNPAPEARQGQQDILADNAFENLETNGTNLVNTAPPTTTEDITGLLDDVFNQAGDTADTNPNPTSTVPEPPKPNEAAAAAADSTSQPVASGTAPSQFDELFGTDVTFDLGGTDAAIGDGNLGDFDFDEEWLKM